MLFQFDLHLELYAPSADGKRFLIARPASGGAPLPMDLRVSLLQ